MSTASSTKTTNTPFKSKMTTKAPYTVTHYIGGPHLALATVGALPHNDPMVATWNAVARNNTRYRNIVLIGHDANAEYKFLGTNPHFPHLNPFNFATVGAILDCQRLYAVLNPAVRNKVGLEYLISYCFPTVDTSSLHLHNAGNDAYWELRLCMALLARLAAQHAPGSDQRRAYPKLWAAIFVCIDVEAWNGRQERLTELGFAWLDSRHIDNIHRHDFDNRIRASHMIIKGRCAKDARAWGARLERQEVGKWEYGDGFVLSSLWSGAGDRA